MQPRKFRGTIPYEFRHLATKNLFVPEEADKFMPDSDPPSVMMVEEALSWVIGYIEENHSGVSSECIEMITLYIQNNEVAKVSYSLKTEEKK